MNYLIEKREQTFIGQCERNKMWKFVAKYNEVWYRLTGPFPQILKYKTHYLTTLGCDISVFVTSESQLWSNFVGSRIYPRLIWIPDDVIKWKHFPRYWSLWGDSTGDWRIPLKNSDEELWYFLWFAPEQTVEQAIGTPVIWNAIAHIRTSL